MKATLAIHPSRSYIYVLAFIIMVLLVAGGMLSAASLPKIQTAALPANGTIITQQVLEQKYGLQLNLLAVTAAGGMVDVRLKMVDAEKARFLLQDPQNFPALLVDGGKVKINATEDTSRSISFEDNGGLFLLFPNAGNAVRPGTPVTIVFGDLQLEPVPAR